MTEAMPFLRKLILLSYDPRPLCTGHFLCDDMVRTEDSGEQCCPYYRCSLTFPLSL